MVEGFNTSLTLVLAGGLNLSDKRFDLDCWLRSGFESPQRQHGLKASFWIPTAADATLSLRVTLLYASFGGLIIY